MTKRKEEHKRRKADGKARPETRRIFVPFVFFFALFVFLFCSLIGLSWRTWLPVPYQCLKPETGSYFADFGLAKVEDGRPCVTRKRRELGVVEQSELPQCFDHHGVARAADVSVFDLDG